MPKNKTKIPLESKAAEEPDAGSDMKMRPAVELFVVVRRNVLKLTQNLCETTMVLAINFSIRRLLAGRLRVSVRAQSKQYLPTRYVR